MKLFGFFATLGLLAVLPSLTVLLADERCQEAFKSISFAKMAREEAARYWKKELRPIFDLVQGKHAPMVVGTIGERLPEPVKKALAQAYRCGAGAVCLGNHGIKLGFAPAFVLWDGARVPLTMAAKAMKTANPTHESNARLLIMPAEIIYKNAPHIVGYSVMSAVGWNVPDLLKGSSSTVLREFDQAVPRTSDAEPEELMVIVRPQGAEEVANKSAEYFITQARFAGFDDRNVVFLTVASPRELVEELAKFREKGRIKELVIIGHGSPGSVDFRSSGIEDLANPSKWFDGTGELSRASLEEIRPAIERWPSDLFASNARINLVSCRAARGEDGKVFLKELGGILLQQGGTIVGSPRNVQVAPWASKDEYRYVNESVSRALTYHFGAVPFAFLMGGIQFGLVTNALSGEFSQEAVRVVQISN